MADSTLANRYQQYKAGTSKLVNWLASTACRSGDVTNILDPNQPTSEGKISVTTPQLLKLAQVITNASIMVPDEVG